MSTLFDIKPISSKIIVFRKTLVNKRNYLA